MFVDELTIEAKAGNGGDGVVRWLRLRHMPKGGPAGGNGGNGGSVYIRAVRDLNILSKYTGEKLFAAENGQIGGSRSKYGHHGADRYIDLPVGSTVIDTARERVYHLERVGDVVRILAGGQGGLGNERFKSSTNQTPEESTKGTKGEQGTFYIELALSVDAGFIGLPNAGKSTLLNTLTNARSAVGAYPFTTTEPHLGSLYGFVLADIPGLIQGAASGKGLGHTFLRHVRRTKMLVHLVSLENEDVAEAYRTVRNELTEFDPVLSEKVEWVVLTKTDIVTSADVTRAQEALQEHCETIFTLSAETKEGTKEFQDALLQRLEAQETAAPGETVA